MKIKLKIQIFDLIEIMYFFSKVEVHKITDYHGFLIVDFFKEEKINILKKIEKARDENKKEIKLNFNRATAAAIYHFLISVQADDTEQSNRFAYIAGILHKQLLDSLISDFSFLELENKQDFKQLKK